MYSFKLIEISKCSLKLKFCLPLDDITNQEIGQLRGREILIDGKVFKVKNIESYSTCPPRYIINGHIGFLTEEDKND